MSSNKTRPGDWKCPTCQFMIWASKPKCLKCGFDRLDLYGSYNYLKGGYYGEALPGEPANLIYPCCGCDGLINCPQRHHEPGCHCYTCRGKPHKW